MRAHGGKYNYLSGGGGEGGGGSRACEIAAMPSQRNQGLSSITREDAESKIPFCREEEGFPTVPTLRRLTASFFDGLDRGLLEMNFGNTAENG